MASTIRQAVHERLEELSDVEGGVFENEYRGEPFDQYNEYRCEKDYVEDVFVYVMASTGWEYYFHVEPVEDGEEYIVEVIDFFQKI